MCFRRLKVICVKQLSNDAFNHQPCPFQAVFPEDAALPLARLRWDSAVFS